VYIYYLKLSLIQFFSYYIFVCANLSILHAVISQDMHTRTKVAELVTYANSMLLGFIGCGLL